MRRAAVGLRFVGLTFAAGSLLAQNATPQAAPKVNRAEAYYYYSLGHMYAEMAGIYGGRNDYVNQSIDNFKAAIKADPTAPMLAEELSEVYIQHGRIAEAQTDGEAALKANPNDLSARRLLARIYLRRIGGDGRNRIDEAMLKKALEQFQKITELDPKDADAWLMYARLQKVSNNSAESEKAYKTVLALEPENEDALTGLALVYSDLGDTKQAAELLQKAASLRPSLTSLEALANAYEQSRDFDKAAATLRRAIELDPPNATQLKRALAHDLEFANRPNEALEVYQDLVAQDGTDSQSWLNISQVYLRLRDTKKAREAVDKARAIEPNGIEIRYQEVSILDAEGKTAEGIQVLKDVLNQTEKKSYSQGERESRLILLQRLGSMERDADQVEAAADTFREMVNIDPNAGPRSSALVIDTYRQGKQLAKAQQEADASEKKYPADRSLRLVRASLQADLGKTDAAASDIKKLLGGKDDREIYLSLAQIYDKGRKWDEMGKALDEAEKLSLDEDDKISVWFMRGAMHERMKSLDKAEAEFRKVLAAAPDNAGALNYLSYMFADKNIKLAEAEKLIDKALEQDPYNGAYLDTLGWLYYRQGRLNEAETLLTKALDRVPHDPTMRDHLAEVLYQRSKYKEAVVQWEAALREWQTSSPADLDQAEVNKVRNKLDSARNKVGNAK